MKWQETFLLFLSKNDWYYYMSSIKFLNLVLLAVIGGAISGCAMFQQDSDITLIREPGQRRYGLPVRVLESAKQFKEYAILSTNVYGDTPQRLQEAIGTSLQHLQKAPPSAPISNIKSCINSPKGTLPLDGWRYRDDFPSEALKREAESIGLAVRIFENTTISRPRIAVVFRETDGLSDWH